MTSVIALALVTVLNTYPAGKSCRYGSGCPDSPGKAAELEEFYTLHPTDIHANDARLQRADIEFFAHRWPQAVNAYRQADIRGLSKPDRSIYAYRMALSLIKTGHYNEAAEWLPLMQGKDMRNARLFYTAYLDYIKGDFKRALAGFEKVTPGIPGLEAGYYMLQILYSRGQYRDVVSRADRMMYRNPVPQLTAEMHRITGMSYFKLGDYDNARVSLLNYLDQNQGGTDAEALYALGAIDYAAGDYSEAEERFEQITDARTELAQSAWLYIGQCRLMDDNVQGATLAFEKAAACETDPAVTQTAMYNYITAMTRGGNIPFARSAQLLESYLQRWPDSPHTAAVEESLAAAYFNDHDYAKAVACVDGVKTRPTRNMLLIKQKALYEQGVSLAVNGDAKGSASWFARAAEMHDADAQLACQSLLWLGDARYASGDFKRAITDYNRYLKCAPSGRNRSLGLYNLAYAQYRAGSYGDAAATFMRAMEARPALTASLRNDAMIRRADCLYYTGDYDGARTLYAGALKNGSQDADYAAYRHAIMTGMTAGQRSKVEALDKFIHDYPQSRWLSAALLEKAQTLEELGESSRAAEAYRRRMALSPDIDVDEMLNMAHANDAAGDAPAEQLELLKRIRHAGGLGADELADLSLYEANALAALNRDNEADAIYTQLADNPSALSGATAAVILAERLLGQSKYKQAYDSMIAFTDAGTPHAYWLARGFIALADACNGLGKKDLAREYLLSLRDNYPGNESDILSAIQSRLNKYGKK